MDTRIAGAALPEQCQRRREAVDEVVAAHRAELAGGEQAAERDGTERPADQRSGVVVGLVEQPGAPTVAGEEEGGVGPAAGQAGRQVVATPWRRRGRRTGRRCRAVRGPRRPAPPRPARHPAADGRGGRAGPGSRTLASTQRPSRSPLPSMPAMSARPRCSAISSTMHSMAGRPAISSTRFRSTRVTVSSRPNGRQPWDSTGTTSVAGPSRTATAPPIPAPGRRGPGGCPRAPRPPRRSRRRPAVRDGGAPPGRPRTRPREGERVGEHQDGRGGEADWVPGQPVERATSRRAGRVAASGERVPAGRPVRPTG